MKPVPTISPELHGLLDEIVSDPRSALRLAPRRALLPWIDSGDTVSGRSLDASKAERHLLAVHRAELAQLLLNCAWGAFEDEPGYAHAPRDSAGRLVDIGCLRADWEAASHRFLDSAPRLVPEIALLRDCLVEGRLPAHRLAQASLALAPSDKARYCVALTLPWRTPAQSVAILQRLAVVASDSRVRLYALNLLAARLLELGWPHLALAQYERAACEFEQDMLACFYAFNLSLLVGDPGQALRYSNALKNGSDPIQVSEAIRIVAKWSRTVAPRALARGRRVAARIEPRLSPQGLELARAANFVEAMT